MASRFRWEKPYCASAWLRDQMHAVPAAVCRCNIRHHLAKHHVMPRSIVCITFDFDAISGWIARGMTSPSPISRGEFGPDVGVPRILDLLARYSMPTSWYVPGHTIETYPDPCGKVA